MTTECSQIIIRVPSGCGGTDTGPTYPWRTIIDPATDVDGPISVDDYYLRATPTEDMEWELPDPADTENKTFIIRNNSDFAVTITDPSNGQSTVLGIKSQVLTVFSIGSRYDVIGFATI